MKKAAIALSIAAAFCVLAGSTTTVVYTPQIDPGTTNVVIVDTRNMSSLTVTATGTGVGTISISSQASLDKINYYDAPMNWNLSLDLATGTASVSNALLATPFVLLQIVSDATNTACPKFQLVAHCQ